MSLFHMRYCRGCTVFRDMCISKTIYKTLCVYYGPDLSFSLYLKMVQESILRQEQLEVNATSPARSVSQL
jgi:hypothetical protein